MQFSRKIQIKNFRFLTKDIGILFEIQHTSCNFYQKIIQFTILINLTKVASNLRSKISILKITARMLRLIVLIKRLRV